MLWHAGVGYKMEQELTQMGLKTAADVRTVSKASLNSKFGERIGTFLYLACRGLVSLHSTAYKHFSPAYCTAQHNLQNVSYQRTAQRGMSHSRALHSMACSRPHTSALHSMAFSIHYTSAPYCTA